MGKRICLLIITGLLIFNETNAQLPDFIERLDGGKVQSGDFFEKIPFELVENRIYVSSLINNHKYRFLIDTYSPCLLYNYVLDEVKLDTIDKSATLGKSFLTGFLIPVFPKIDTFSIGNIKFSDVGAMLMKKDSTNPLKDYIMDGILGSNLMKHCIWQFNFIDSTITITNDLSKCSYVNNAIQFPLIPKPVQASPNIFMLIGNDTINVEFDTGNNGFINVLSPGINKKITEGEAIAWSVKLDIPVNRADVDNIETHYYVMIDSMQIGEHTFYLVPAVAYNPEYTQTMGKGSVGIDFLKHFITTIDWIENTIYLKPIKGEGRMPHNKKTFGFTYGYENGGFNIQSVFAGSRADSLGFEIGDKIISINGFDLTQLTEKQIDKFRQGTLDFLQKKDDKISILLLKNGVKISYTIESYNLFGNNLEN
ncbi:MAG: hypothetical protein GXO79_15880 [Chlorobi bacterium]|nr:hypothetical protein [Chlorobiota bacterium]